MTAATMVGFGRKTAWLAVRSGDADDTLAALGSHRHKEVDWRSGLDRAYVADDWLAVTPPLASRPAESTWLLITGRWLLLNEAWIDPVELSERLGTDVQFFATDRVAEYHRWSRAVKGILVRSFAYLGQSGEVVVWSGDPDDTERSLGLPVGAPDPDDSILVGEDDVLRIAAAWSIDPAALDGQPAPGRLLLAPSPGHREPDQGHLEGSQ
jgi:hypothetical protein